MVRFRSGKDAARFAERRQREDDAQRLCDVVPTLEALRLEIEERRDATASPDVKYVRHVVVARAPALFVLQCTDRGCDEGEYDITHEILYGLTHGQSRVEGEERCSGSRGTAECGRVIHFVADATFR